MTSMTDYADSAVLSAANLTLVEELRSTRELIKKLKARESEIRDVLLVELADIDFGLTAAGVPVIEVERQPRTRVDSKRLQALYEDVWEDCQIESTVEVLRLPDALKTPDAV